MGREFEQRKLRTNMQNFFTVMLMEHWIRLPREVAESPSMQVFKTQMPTCAASFREPALLGGLYFNDLLTSLPTPVILCDQMTSCWL